MKSYKNYQSKTTSENTQNQTAQQSQTAQELTKKIAQAYNGRSNNDMFREILAQAEEGKRKGTLTNEEIENFYLAFSPMLDSAQSKRLRVIVDRLKEI